MMILQGKKDLVAVDSTELEEEDRNLRDSDDEETRKESQEQCLSDLDSDDERRRWFSLALLTAS